MAVTEARGRQPKSAVQPPESVKLTKSNASRADKTIHIKQKHVLTHFNQIKKKSKEQNMSTLSYS